MKKFFIKYSQSCAIDSAFVVGIYYEEGILKFWTKDQLDGEGFSVDKALENVFLNHLGVINGNACFRFDQLNKGE